MESCAFGVPTITTSLSGFGMWCKGIGKTRLQDGVGVVPRTDSNYEEVVNRISDMIINFTEMGPGDVKVIRQDARKIAARADWKHFIKYYNLGYNQALMKVQSRQNLE